MAAIPGVVGYAEQADTLIAEYESLSFVTIHGDIAHFFPKLPARVLDIGAGTGRDAAAFAARGYAVAAIEPTEALRKAATRLHAAAPIEWLDDHLPGLKTLSDRHDHFDLIMLTAVWMHLDEQERSIAMPHLARLLAKNGRIIITLRHGPIPSGRRMFDVQASETIALARAAGLNCLYSAPRADQRQRAEITWSVMVFAKQAKV